MSRKITKEMKEALIKKAHSFSLPGEPLDWEPLVERPREVFISSFLKDKRQRLHLQLEKDPSGNLKCSVTHLCGEIGGDGGIIGQHVALKASELSLEEAFEKLQLKWKEAIELSQEGLETTKALSLGITTKPLEFEEDR